MTFEEFAGTPRITEDLAVEILRANPGAPRVPFLGEFHIAHSTRRHDVWHGDIWIATFYPRYPDGCTRIWVHEKYRRRGIAEELIIAVIEHTGVETLHSTQRTPSSHRLYRRVYNRRHGQ